jgi:DNA-binding NtrC family response regulator
MHKPRILIADDEIKWLDILQIILKDQGYQMDLV